MQRKIANGGKLARSQSQKYSIAQVSFEAPDSFLPPIAGAADPSTPPKKRLALRRFRSSNTSPKKSSGPRLDTINEGDELGEMTLIGGEPIVAPVFEDFSESENTGRVE